MVSRSAPACSNNYQASESPPLKLTGFSTTAYRVRGDTMAPELCEGDIVLVDESEDFTPPAICCVTFIEAGQQVETLAVVEYVKDCDLVALISVNWSYPTRFIRRCEIKAIAPVVEMIRKLTAVGARGGAK